MKGIGYIICKNLSRTINILYPINNRYFTSIAFFYAILLFLFSWSFLITTLALTVLIAIGYHWIAYLRARPLPGTLIATTDTGRILWYAASPYPFPFTSLHTLQELCPFILDPETRALFEDPAKLSSQVPYFIEVKYGTRLYSLKIKKHVLTLGPIIWNFEPYTPTNFLHNLKKAFNTHPWPFCVTSQEGHIGFVNTAFTQWLGYSSSDLFGKDLLLLFKAPPTSWEEFKTQFYSFKDIKGNWVAGTIAHVAPFPDHNLVGLFFCPADTTYPLEALGDFSLLNLLPLPAALLDEHGGMKQLNPLLREKLHHPSGNTLSLNQWIAEKDRYIFSKTLKKMRKASMFSESLILRFRNQENHPTTAFLKYLKGPDLQTPGQFLVAFDYTERVMPSKDSDPHSDPQRLQILGQLASGIVHDFNNLLTGIMGFCDLLMQKHTPEEASFKDIEQIKQSSMRAARLIQQLLAFSKATPPSQAPIEINACLRDLTPLIRRMIGPKILLSVQENLPAKYIYGDQGQLEQVLLNLAINARDSMADGGSLTLRVRPFYPKTKVPLIKGSLAPRRYIIIDIIDTGTGIDPKHIPHIFDAFFSTKDPGQGTGLGLSNVLQTMEQFQGGISVDTALGKGTTFSLYFPEHKGADAPAVATSSDIQAPSTHRSIKILLVEDEDPVRLFASRALREQGHEVIEARDGTQAIKLLQRHTDIQVVVTDVMMPGIDGPSLAAAVKNIHPAIKILFVSGYPEDEVRSQLPEAIQGVYFLQKPFALADLVSEIQKLFNSDASI